MPATTYRTSDSQELPQQGWTTLALFSGTATDPLHNTDHELKHGNLSAARVRPLERQTLHGLSNNYSILEFECLTQDTSERVRSRAIDRLLQDIVVAPSVPASSNLAPIVQPSVDKGLLPTLTQLPSQTQLEPTSFEQHFMDAQTRTIEIHIDSSSIVDQLIDRISRTRYGSMAHRLGHLHRCSINDPEVDTISPGALWSACRVLESTNWALPLAIGLADGGSIQMLWESEDTEVSAVVTFLPNGEARFAALDDEGAISDTVHYTFVEEELDQFICRI